MRRDYATDGTIGQALKRAEERQSFPTWVAFTLALIAAAGMVGIALLGMGVV